MWSGLTLGLGGGTLLIWINDQTARSLARAARWPAVKAALDAWMSVHAPSGLRLLGPGPPERGLRSTRSQPTCQQRIRFPHAVPLPLRSSAASSLLLTADDPTGKRALSEIHSQKLLEEIEIDQAARRQEPQHPHKGRLHLQEHLEQVVGCVCSNRLATIIR